MRVSVFVSVWIVAVSVLFVAGAPATAQTETPNRSAFQKIISDQMKAFADGDAGTAFSFATRSLQQRFQTPAIFMDMVKRGYRPVYRPKDVIFGAAKTTANGPAQEVYVTGPDGNSWLAVYTFEHQEDGSWRISGCYLTRSPGLSA